MWRAFFLAIGITLCILGGECLVIDNAVLAAPASAASAEDRAADNGQVAPSQRFSPPEWVGWSLLSAGAVVCLYSFTVPQRVAN